MWSVKWLPKPGLARISASRSSLTGLLEGVVLICMGVTVVDLCLGRVTGRAQGKAQGRAQGNARPPGTSWCPAVAVVQVRSPG
jgi:hypothetical protein